MWDRGRLHYSVPMTENSAELSTPSVRRGGSRRPASADQERLVRRYLSALEVNKAGRGVKRAADAVGNRITKVDELLVSADPLSRVHLTQERIELHAEYVRITNGNHPDQGQLERDFIRVVRSYGDRNGITYAAWRQVGVDAKVLEQAGIQRADKKPPPAALRAAESALAESSAPPPGEAPPSTDETAESTEAPGTALNGSVPSAIVPGRTTTPDDPPTPPPSEVDLDELADLLAEASPGAPAPAKDGSAQPPLSEDLGPVSGLVANRPSRSPEAAGS